MRHHALPATLFAALAVGLAAPASAGCGKAHGPAAATKQTTPPPSDKRGAGSSREEAKKASDLESEGAKARTAVAP